MLMQLKIQTGLSAMRYHTIITLTIIKADMMFTVMHHTSLTSGFSCHMEIDRNSHNVVVFKNRL